MGRIPGREATTSTELALEACHEAMAGGRPPGTLALVGASTAGDMSVGEEAFHLDSTGVDLPSKADFLWPQLSHRPTERVREALGVDGPCLTISTACTSGTVALGVGRDLLRTQQADAVLVFGADALCRTTTWGFGSLGVHAAEVSRPFDRDRKGMNLGEAGAALLLEPLGRALARGARPLALIEGYATSSDAYHLTSPDPTGAGAKRAILEACGGWPLDRIDLINAHGTGTELNDAMEAQVVGELFPEVAVTAIKGAVGHTLGAAGALEAVLTVLSIAEGRIPPVVGLRETDFGIDLVRTERRQPVRAALSVNFAFGGHNAAVLLTAP